MRRQRRQAQFAHEMTVDLAGSQLGEFASHFERELASPQSVAVADLAVSAAPPDLARLLAGRVARRYAAAAAGGAIALAVVRHRSST